MTIGLLPELDEVEGHPVRGEVAEVQGEEYDLPLARAIQAIQYDEGLSHKAWLDDGLDDVLGLFPDLSDEHKALLRGRDLEELKVALAKESEAAGVPAGHIIVWALVRV